MLFLVELQAALGEHRIECVKIAGNFGADLALYTEFSERQGIKANTRKRGKSAGRRASLLLRACCLAAGSFHAGTGARRGSTKISWWVGIICSKNF